MLVYIIMILLSCFFCFKSIKTEDRKKKTLYQILSALPFIIISAIRYDVGTDYMIRYKPGFETILKGKEVFNYELGFALLNKFCLLFTDHYQSIFIVTSIIIYSLIFHTIYKKSDKPILSIIIFFIGAFFFESMNGIRQFLAMSILMYGFTFIENKDISKLIVCGLIAYFIHNISLLLFLPMLFFSILVKYKKNIKTFNYWYIILAFFVIIIFKDLILNAMYFILQFTRFKTYIGGRYDYGDFQIIPIIVNIIIYIYMYLKYYNKKDESNEIKILINFQMIGVMLLLLTGINTLFLRIAYMFTIFQILAIPLLSDNINIDSIKNFNIKQLKRYFNIEEIKKEIARIQNRLKKILLKLKKSLKKYRITNIKEIKNINYKKMLEESMKIKIPLTVIIVAYLLSFSYINIFHNVEECLPYRTIIGSEKYEKK